jgi:hypothetical protein
MLKQVSSLAVAVGAVAALAACSSGPDYTYTQPATTTVMVPAQPVVVPSAPVIVQPQQAYVPSSTTYVLPTVPTYVAPTYVAPTYVAPSYAAPAVVSSGSSPITENKDVRRNAENGGGQ